MVVLVLGWPLDSGVESRVFVKVFCIVVSQVVLRCESEGDVWRKGERKMHCQSCSDFSSFHGMVHLRCGARR